MLLKDLLLSTEIVDSIGNLETNITGIAIDSRRVRPGFLFVAVKGTQTDGHAFVDKAIENGAAALVVCEPVNAPKVSAVVRVSDTEKLVGSIATRFYGDPSHKLRLVGVTGTNGKTTVATVLYQLYRGLGYKVGLVSTVCNYIDDRTVEATHTTPDPIELNALLAEMVEAGCDYAFMECSSHAIHQHRIGGLHFEGALFTNLTRDHLDYHGTVQEYLRAKKSFFDGLGKDAFALTNADDKNGAVMLQNTRAHKYSYALRAAADYRAEILELYPYGTQLRIAGVEVLVRLVGEFNVYNLLAVYVAATLLGMSKEEALRRLSELTAVDGRFQSFISEKRGYIAVVDYAHTPDALVNVLETLSSLRSKGAKIICVVGCGGDRDRGKRPIMAHEAAVRADRLILTSDNPRSEDPVAIIEEMRAGLSPEELSRTLSITDRAEAIRTATMLASAGDLILVAGKGHETYQEIAGVRHHFDDREIILEQFAHEA